MPWCAKGFSGRLGDRRGNSEALRAACFDIRQCGSHGGTSRNQARDSFGRIERCTGARIDDELRIAERQFDLFRHHEQFRQIELERRHDVFDARARDDGQRRFGAIDLRAGTRLAGGIAIGIDLALGARGLELPFALRRLDLDRTTARTIAFALHACRALHVTGAAALARAGAVATPIALIAEHIVTIAGARSFANTLAGSVAGDCELRGAFAFGLACGFAAAREFSRFAARNDLRRGDFTSHVRATSRFATRLQTRIDRADRRLEGNGDAGLACAFLDFRDGFLTPSVDPLVSLRFGYALGVFTKVDRNGLASVGNIGGHAGSRRGEVGHCLHERPVIDVGLTNQAPVDGRQIIARNEFGAAECLLSIDKLVTTDHRDQSDTGNSKRQSEQTDFRVLFHDGFSLQWFKDVASTGDGIFLEAITKEKS